MPGGINGKELGTALLEKDQSLKIIISSGYHDDPVMARFPASMDLPACSRNRFQSKIFALSWALYSRMPVPNRPRDNLLCGVASKSRRRGSLVGQD